jgi:tRNA U34 5-methylaminomethyl-2-thiouridine-forming methyltransferase MnmC
MFEQPPDFVPYRTRDGSFTLRSEQLDVFHHSVHGAVQESMHVFIDEGLKHVAAKHIDVLEVGLGTGLNALLTWIHAMESDKSVRYTALEPYPVQQDVLVQIDHPGALLRPDLRDSFLEMMRAPEGAEQQMADTFTFMRSAVSAGALREVERYDIVYFDAFAPRTQPELWTEDVFRCMHDALRPGGILVTYCAKGNVRRAMLAAGFTVDRVPGPPAKRQMLRATRPLVP